MSDARDRPQIGLGVIILNQEGKVLIGKRKGSHAPFYSIPGGTLELGETFEEGSKREIKEETDLDINNPEVIAVTNNLATYYGEGVHYVSIIILVQDFSGEPKIMEPEKCAGWSWVDPRNLPTPHFEASQTAIACYLEKKFYRDPPN
jgi:8-oxo-dGTP diphosphatase